MKFGNQLDQYNTKKGVRPATILRETCPEFKELPAEQLREAIAALPAAEYAHRVLRGVEKLGLDRVDVRVI